MKVIDDTVKNKQHVPSMGFGTVFKHDKHLWMRLKHFQAVCLETGEFKHVDHIPDSEVVQAELHIVG